MSSPPWHVADRGPWPESLTGALAREGWRVEPGLALPNDPWNLTDRRWVRVAHLESDEDVADAVEAAVRGVGLVVACADGDRRARLVDDLARLGPVDVVERGPDPFAALDDDQRALLAALADGSSLAGAAATIFMSQRTAERRVAAARKALGVRTTAEAVALYVTSTT